MPPYQLTNQQTLPLTMTANDGTSNREAFFLERDHQHLFCYVRRPAHTEPRAWLIHLPAFSEEMNKSRHMVTLAADAFAAAGFGVVIFDYTGTGDSSGDFEDARLEGWQADVNAVCHWIRQQGDVPLIAWALRFGALMVPASDVVDAVLLWNPVATGKEVVNQNLRLRVMASRLEGVEESAKALRAQLRGGESIEIGGYAVHPALVDALDSVTMSDCQTTTAWLEVSNGESLPPGRQRVVDGMATPPVVSVVGGEPFWSTAEIATAPELIEASLDVLREWSAS